MKTDRVVSIDRMKGFIVFCMLFFVGASDFECLGILARVANRNLDPIELFDGFTLADLEIPAFVFLTSITYQISFSKRYAKDGKKAYLHFIERNLYFVGLGCIMFAFEEIFYRKVFAPLVCIQAAFMFAVALLALASFVIRLVSKKNNQLSKARNIVNKGLKHTLLTLGVIGVISAIYNMVQIELGYSYGEIIKYWSILHQIGVTGLLTIPFIKMNKKQKTISWIAVTVLYTLIQLIPGVVERCGIIVLGGGFGCFGWLSFCLGTMVMSEQYSKKDGKVQYLITLAIILVCALLSCKYLVLNTRAVTINYVLLTLFIVMTAYAIINLFDNIQTKFDFFVWFGRNPLLLFCVGVVFKGILMFWNPAPDTSIAVAVLSLGFAFSVFGFIAYYCYKHEIYIKL